YPFLEGGLPGSTAPIAFPQERAQALPPSIDDGTVYEVLTRLVVFQGQRLSYAALDVEQIGSVDESLMGYHVLRATSPAVRLGKNRVWLEVLELRGLKVIERQKRLKEVAGLSKAQIARAEKVVKEHSSDASLAEALSEL